MSKKFQIFKIPTLNKTYKIISVLGGGEGGDKINNDGGKRKNKTQKRKNKYQPIKKKRLHKKHSGKKRK